MSLNKYFIHPLSVVEEGAKIGNNSKVWHFAHVRSGCEIGNNCIIGKGVFIDSDVKIGNKVKIQNNVSVYHGVEIEDGVFVGPHVCFTNDKKPRAISPNGDLLSADGWVVSKTRVAYGASIGANSTIVCGIKIGKWSMIAAGSVVTKDVPDYALIMGNPAKLYGKVNEKGEIVERKK